MNETLISKVFSTNLIANSIYSMEDTLVGVSLCNFQFFEQK
jgi:hypothetical protein